MNDINMTVSGADILQQKIRAMGKRARPAMRKATYGVAREMVKAFKSAAKDAGFKKSTGATMRSIGIKRLKDGTMKVGVRYDYADKKSMKSGTLKKPKIPNMYAAKVNKNNPWFSRAWDANRDEWAQKTITAVRSATTP